MLGAVSAQAGLFSSSILTGDADSGISAETWGAGATNALNHIEVLLTDPTDQNPFDGVGQTDIAVYSNGTPVYNYSRTGGGYSENFINFGSTYIGGADNLRIARVVPEPSAVCSLLGGLGLLLARRRRRA